ncbi:MAG: anti-sigma factor family protein [Solirubrobacterales bacterium]
MREHRWTQAHLSDYVDQELPDAERHRAEEHIGLCPECRRVLATLKRMLESLHGLRAAQEPSVADGVIERLRDEG